MPLILNVWGQGFDSPQSGVACISCIVVVILGGPLLCISVQLYGVKGRCSGFGPCIFSLHRYLLNNPHLQECVCVWLHRSFFFLEIPFSKNFLFYYVVRSDINWEINPIPAACLCSRAHSFLSHTESSEDEEEDESGSDGDDDDDDEEESGLGLLARFAASALPVSPPPLSLLHDGKHSSSRQSALGKHKQTQTCPSFDSDVFENKNRKF